MPIILDGTAGITNDSGYTGDGVVFADATPANTLVTTVGGNVGIGTSSPLARMQVSTAGTSTTPNANTVARFVTNGSNADAHIQLSNGVNSSANIGIAGGANLYFATDGAERARIDSSGSLLVGVTTSVSSGTFGMQITNGGQRMAVSNSTPSSSVDFYKNQDGAMLYFLRSGNIVGNISVTSTATTYATSSDYRLKDTIAPMTGALAKVALLKPCTYKWKIDGSDGQGFIAHELDEVVPGSVTGAKDAVDAEGNPQYQGIDTSFLVATLAVAIQELKAITDTQATRITALEGAAA